MTPQEIFDKAATHLLAQGAKSLDDDGNCMYRGAGGLRCAVGCLIPDDLCTPDIEHLDVAELIFEGPPSMAEWIRAVGDRVALLRRLQSIHDDYPPYAWREQLALCAKGHKLDPNTIYRHQPSQETPR